MKLVVTIFFLISFFLTVSCQPPLKEDKDFLENLMKRHPKEFERVLKDRDSLEVQIIYTQIDRDSLNEPHFRSFYYNVDSNRYFYPASTVKLPMVLLALEKLRALNIKGLDKYTPMFNDSAYAGQFSVKKDTTSENGLPSVAHYAKKILLVSDNDASNRLYEFMGQEAANRILNEKGYHVRILQRLERGLPPDQNRHTEAVRFVRNDTVIFSQPMLVNKDSIMPPARVLKGTSYLDKNDSLVKGAFDFTYKNFYTLTDQQRLLRSLLFPQTVPAAQRFNIPEEDRQFVMKYMSQLPTETIYPPYSKDPVYHDAFCKFLMFGDDTTKIPNNIRIFNKVGDAYGYLIDNAYIVDFENGVEFMLSAVINTNTDQVYNDGIYEYKTIGFPFMRNLGRAIYEYDKQRKRPRKPDLSAFKFIYDKPAF